MQAELGLHTGFAIDGFRVAGDLAVGAVFEARIATVVHLVFVGLVIVNDGDVGAEAALPRLVKDHGNTGLFRMVQLQRGAFHLVDEQLVHKQLTAGADGGGFFREGHAGGEAEEEGEKERALHMQSYREGGGDVAWFGKQTRALAWSAETRRALPRPGHSDSAV